MLKTNRKQYQTKPIKTAIITWLIFISALISSSVALADFKPIPEESLTTTIEMRNDLSQAILYLNRKHYRKLRLDDNLSSKILSRYLEILDPSRQYFYASDIEQFKKNEFKIDDQLKQGDLEFGFDIYKVLRYRINERKAYVDELLKTNFDFTIDEEHILDRSELPWPNSKAEMNDIWRKKIKNQYLIQLLAGTSEAKIRDSISKTYKNHANIIWQNKPEEVFELFLNAYTREVGPHTQYMSRVTAENFNIQMSLSLEGIGASLQNDDDHTIVKKIISGGPADKNGQLKVDDKIIGVGQSEKNIENVTGWRLMDVVKQIRGKKGSTVFLKVLPGGDLAASPEVIAIVRDVIQLEDKAAKLEYQKVNDRNFAVIEIPLFYADRNNYKNGHSTSNDVKKLLTQAVMEQKIDGVIFDLRGNGGGFLEQVLLLTGLFIDTGPAVQIQYSNSHIESLPVLHRGTIYDGPIAVLVDQHSASASEIFAAAIQDYGRGIVIGERTFGKGTVQNASELEQLEDHQVKSILKYTSQQFFRINGASTQVKGVTPDVLLDIGNRSDYGEGMLDNALPWKQIKPARYKRNILFGFEDLSQKHQARAQQSAAFKFLRADAMLREQNQNLTAVPLNKKTRQAWFNQREANRIKSLNEYRQSLNLKPLDRKTIKDANKDMPDKEKHWDRVFQKESALILNDYLDMKTGKNMAKK